MKSKALLALTIIIITLFLQGCSTNSSGHIVSATPTPSPTSQGEEILTLEAILGPVAPGSTIPYPNDPSEQVNGAISMIEDNGNIDEIDKLVVIISDLHLGDQRSIDDGYGWTIKNEDLLADFLNHLAIRPAVDELVIAGDMFDEWVIPMEYDTFNGFGSNQAGESKFADSIALAHPEIVNAINKIIASGVKVTYIPGNHDMLLTETDINRIFPGINQKRDAAGLGAYSPDGLPEVIIEHSHRYDFFNAPDMYSNRIPYSLQNYTNNANAIIPPGFFVSKIAATHSLEYPALPSSETTSQSKSGPYLYWVAWQLILSQIPVTQDHDAKDIKTGIDGYTGVYAINDLTPKANGFSINEPLLYQKIEDNWQKRQAQNRVNVPIGVASALLTGSLDLWCDFQASTQYFFHDLTKRIVVFGHTHHATLDYRVNSNLEKCIYANSGTWIDKGNPDRTFVIIKTKPQDDGTIDEYVSLYQFTESHQAKKLGEDMITK